MKTRKTSLLHVIHTLLLFLACVSVSPVYDPHLLHLLLGPVHCPMLLHRDLLLLHDLPQPLHPKLDRLVTTYSEFIQESISKNITHRQTEAVRDASRKDTRVGGTHDIGIGVDRVGAVDMERGSNSVDEGLAETVGTVQGEE